jgi:GT2 family glycosyltransferase
LSRGKNICIDDKMLIMSKISVIIVTYNNEKTIERCMRSLIAQAPRPQIVIVDNYSQDNTLQLVKKNTSDRQITIIEQKTNLGYAGGNNLGIDIALKNNPDYVIIVNPDAVFNKNTLALLIDQAILNSNQGIFGPEIYQDDSGQKIWSLGGELDKNRWTGGMIGYGRKAKNSSLRSKDAIQVDFISGTCMLIPINLLQQGMRFNEKYFLYYEDTEFCLKAQKMGYFSYVVPAKISHSESSDSPGFKKYKEYYLARNHLLFLENNAPFRVKLRECIRLPKTIYEHYSHKEYFALKGIKDYFLRKFGPIEVYA